MVTHSRRHFIGGALLAGVGASGLVPFEALADPPPLSSPSEADMLDRDPGFVAGQVVDTARDGTLSVVDMDGQVQHLRVHSASNAWKAGAVNAVPIESGDCLFVRGQRDAEGGLEVDRLWANINSFAGDLRQVSSDGIAVRTANDRLHDVRIGSITTVRQRDGRRAQGRASGLSMGEDVQVIGYSDPATGDLTATLVISLNGPPGILRTARRRRGEVRAADITIQHRGVSSWFCCGNVNGCGSNCGSSGAGFCSAFACRSDLHAIAWPKTGSCGPFCSNCCVSSSFPAHSCGTCMDVENPCTGGITRVRIRDCGPTVRCVSAVGCNDYTIVAFDLTPCAFTAVGGRLSAGLIDLWTSPAFAC